jgi:hypothetical protein
LGLCEITVGKGELTVLAILYAKEIQGEIAVSFNKSLLEARTPTFAAHF